MPTSSNYLENNEKQIIQKKQFELTSPGPFSFPAMLAPTQATTLTLPWVEKYRPQVVCRDVR
jgi:hypothetical protein